MLAMMTLCWFLTMGVMIVFAYCCVLWTRQLEAMESRIEDFTQGSASQPYELD